MALSYRINNTCYGCTFEITDPYTDEDTTNFVDFINLHNNRYVIASNDRTYIFNGLIDWEADLLTKKEFVANMIGFDNGVVLKQEVIDYDSTLNDLVTLTSKDFSNEPEFKNVISKMFSIEMLIKMLLRFEESFKGQHSQITSGQANKESLLNMIDIIVNNHAYNVRLEEGLPTLEERVPIVKATKVFLKKIIDTAFNMMKLDVSNPHKENMDLFYELYSSRWEEVNKNRNFLIRLTSLIENEAHYSSSEETWYYKIKTNRNGAWDSFWKDISEDKLQKINCVVSPVNHELYWDPTNLLEERNIDEDTFINFLKNKKDEN